MIERLIEASAPLSGDGDLLLASKSETRARLLAGAGLAFRQEPASIDEAALKDVLKAAGVTGGQAALALAERKAALLSDRQRAAFVIGADQILVCDNLWYDKPADGPPAIVSDIRFAADSGPVGSMPQPSATDARPPQSGQR